LEAAFGNSTVADLAIITARIANETLTYPLVSIQVALTSLLKGPALLSLDDFKLLSEQMFVAIPHTPDQAQREVNKRNDDYDTKCKIQLKLYNEAHVNPLENPTLNGFATKLIYNSTRVNPLENPTLYGFATKKISEPGQIRQLGDSHPSNIILNPKNTMQPGQDRQLGEPAPLNSVPETKYNEMHINPFTKYIQEPVQPCLEDIRYNENKCNDGGSKQSDTTKKLYSIEKSDFATNQREDVTLKPFFAEVAHPDSGFEIQNGVLKKQVWQKWCTT